MRLAALTLSVLLAGSAAAAPLAPSLQSQLLDMFQSYGRALQAGRLDEAMALRDAASRAEFAKEAATADQRREWLAMAKLIAPDSVQVVRASLNAAGTTATVVTVASKTVPKGAGPDAPPPGTVVRSGLTLKFVKEAGQWRFAEQTFGPDPSVRLACPDERNEPASAYDEDKQVSLGGPISRVEFKDGYTLVVVRIVDEANCVFLPPREKLASAGVSAEALVPDAIITVEGVGHRSDKQKMLASHASVTAPQE